MRVAVVGVCGSGKSTISRALRERGFDAYVVGQEHSIVADLWRRRDPDAVVYLDASLQTVRERRGPAWPEWIYDLQVSRLERARAAASVVVDTGAVEEARAAALIVDALAAQHE